MREVAPSDLAAALTDVRVHMIADKFGAENLMSLARLCFEENIQKAWKLSEFGSIIDTVYNQASDRDGQSMWPYWMSLSSTSKNCTRRTSGQSIGGWCDRMGS